MIYLIESESNQLLKEYIANIIKKYENTVYIDYNTSNIDDVLAEASYYSMFNEEKLLIVKNANIFCSDKISEEITNKLLSYFSNPNKLTTIIFITNAKIDLRKKITKYVKDNFNLIQIPSLKPRDLKNKLKEMFENDGYTIEDESLYYIMNNNLNNYDLIYNEVAKIKLFYNKPQKIMYNDVLNIVAKSIETNNFKFIDAIISKDIKEAFKLYNDLKLLKVEPLGLISLLAREYRLMLFTKILKEEHYSIYEISSELNLQDWQLEKISKNASKYKIKTLESQIIGLANLDLKIKSGKIDKWLGLAKFIVDSAE